LALVYQVGYFTDSAGKMINLTVSPDYKSIIIKFPYDAAIVEKVKEELTPRPIYNTIKLQTAEVKKFSHWQIEADADSRARLEAIRSDPAYSIADSVWALFDVAAELRAANYALSMARASDFEAQRLGGVLRDFQRAGADYIARNSGGVLMADEMGLGKTIQALAAVESRERFPLLIVSPAVVKYNWYHESVKWLGHRSINVMDGSSPMEYNEITIINYDLLEKRFDDLDSVVWHTIIFDESHYLKNYKAARTKAATQLAAHAGSRILLSGTPILNRPQELISQLIVMDKIHLFGGFWPFVNRYCKAKKTRFGWDFSGAANLEELNKKLRESCMIRREKREVLSELPEKTRADLWVNINNRPEYTKAESDLIEYLKTDAIIKAAAMAEINEKTQNEFERLILAGATNPAATLESQEFRRALIVEYREGVAQKAARAETLVKIGVLKQIAARGKIDAARAWIRNFFENGKTKLIVFAWHKFIIDELTNEFKCNSITGETSAEDKNNFVHDFQNGAAKMLVCNIQAGGVGITLTAADSSLFLELGWNPGLMDQAEDRIHRIGQEAAAVTIYRMLAESTIDRGVLEMIEAKRGDIENAIDGFEYVRQWLLNREVMK